MTSTIDNWQPRIRVLTVIVIAALLAGLGVWNEITTWQRLVLSSNNRLLETARAIGLHNDRTSARKRPFWKTCRACGDPPPS